MDIGSAVSRQLGVSDEELAALPNYQDSPLFSDTDRLVLDLATAMSRTPVDVSDELRARLTATFTRGQLAALCANIAWENNRARLNRALGVRAMGFSDGAYCVVPERP